MDYQEMLTVPVSVLKNTPKSPFLWTKRDFPWHSGAEVAESTKKYRYKQEKAKVGQRFYDGNNGDRHKVLAADPKNGRMVAQNMSQESNPRLYVWFPYGDTNPTPKDN